MSEKNELLPLVENIMDKNRKHLDKMQAENLIENKEMKDEFIKEIAKNTGELEKLQQNMDVVETKLIKANLQTSHSSADGISKQLNSEDYKEFIKTKEENPKGGQSHSFDVPLNLNAAVVLQPTNFVSGNAPVVLPMREAGVDKAPVRPLLISDIIQWGTTSSNMVDWIERTGKTDGSATRVEGATMAMGDVTYTEKSTKVQIISEYMKVTNESLKDVDFLNSEINSELLSDLRITLDTQLLSGDGSAPNLSGIITNATTWAAGDFATNITSPNNADVLRVGLNQIWIAGKGKFMPNYILMHPTDVATLDLAKIADGRYIEIPFYDAEGKTVASVPIIQNVGITAGTFLIGDFQKAKGFIRDALTIRIFDQNENDPLFNRSTVTGNVRVAFRIKNQEKVAFIKGTFSTAITALTAE